MRKHILETDLRPTTLTFIDGADPFWHGGDGELGARLVPVADLAGEQEAHYGAPLAAYVAQCAERSPAQNLGRFRGAGANLCADLVRRRGSALRLRKDGLLGR